MAAIAAPVKKQTAPSDLLNDAQAAEYLGLAVGTLSVWRCTRRHNIRYLKIGRNVRYRRSDLDAWLKEQEHGGADESE